MLDDDYLHEACTKLFAGSVCYWLNLAQLMDVGRGNNPQPLHRDQWGWPTFSRGGPEVPEVIVNFFVGLRRCTEANGATRVIPGSHRWPDMTGGARPDKTVVAEMNAGDCVLFSGKLLHGGGSNATRDSHRKALSVSVITGCCVAEQANPLRFDKSLAQQLLTRVQSMLGFLPHYPIGSGGIWVRNYDEDLGAQGLELVSAKV